MKRIFAINLVLLFAITSLSFGADVAILDSERPDIPSFIGYVPDTIVVKFDPFIVDMMGRGLPSRGLTGIPALDQVTKRHGVISIWPQFPGAKKKMYKGRVVDLVGWHKVKFARKVDVLAVVKEYKTIPGVIDAQPIGIHTVYADPYEEFYDDQWHLRKVQAPEAWDIETGNRDIIVAILDTGVRYFHKDLGGSLASLNTPSDIDGNMWVNLAEKDGIDGDDDDGNGYLDDWIGWDFVGSTDVSPVYTCLSIYGEDCAEADNDPRDFNGHGTHCAGSVAAITNNGWAVASVAGGWGNETLEPSGNGVRVMPLRIGWSAVYLFWEVGLVRMDYAAQALYYAANNGAKIASCSWGSSDTGGLGAAIDDFLASDDPSGGRLIFKAAGNSGTEDADYMGSRPDVISVAATDMDDCRADFSNYGDWVDISAPGVDIRSLYHSWVDPETDYVAFMSGTSMSAPLAASVAALIWSHNPGWSAEQVKQRLYDSADSIDGLDCNSLYAGKLGAGRINAYRAVSTESPPSPIAEFTASPTSGYAPLDVSFTNQSTGEITSWLWVFGDGGTSNVQNPTHMYTVAGTYTVSLTVSGPDGDDTETKTDFITVEEQADVGVNELETGRYKTTGKGKNKTVDFELISTFNAGDEVVIRAYVVDDASQNVAGATVKITIEGPESTDLTSNPSNNDGVAEAKWKTSAGRGKKKQNGTAPGGYTATVTGVTAEGYTWDGVSTSTTFTIQ